MKIDLKLLYRQAIMLMNGGRILKYLDRILVHEKAGDTAQAVAVAKTMLKLYPAGPDHCEVSIGIARSSLKLKNYPDVKKYCQLALAENPRHRGALSCLAAGEIGDGNYSAALAAINEAIRQLWRSYRQEQKSVNQPARARKDIPMLYFIRGDIYVKQLNFLAAIRDYKMVRRESTRDPYKINFKLGCAFGAINQPALASECFQECLRARPGDKAAQCNYEVSQELLELSAQGACREEFIKDEIERALKGDLRPSLKGRVPTDPTPEAQRLMNKIEKIQKDRARAPDLGRG